jgi:hypothetical protein
MAFVELKLTSTGKSIWVCLPEAWVGRLSTDLETRWQAVRGVTKFGPKYTNCWYVDPLYRDAILSWLHAKPGLQITDLTKVLPAPVALVTTTIAEAKFPTATQAEQIVDKHIHTLMEELPNLKARKLYNLVTDRMAFLLGREQF